MDNNKKNTLKASKKKMTLVSILVMAIFLLLMPLALLKSNGDSGVGSADPNDG